MTFSEMVKKQRNKNNSLSKQSEYNYTNTEYHTGPLTSEDFEYLLNNLMVGNQHLMRDVYLRTQEGKETIITAHILDDASAHPNRPYQLPANRMVEFAIDVWVKDYTGLWEGAEGLGFTANIRFGVSTGTGWEGDLWAPSADTLDELIEKINGFLTETFGHVANNRGEESITSSYYFR